MTLKEYFAKVRETETMQNWCQRNKLNPVSVSLVVNNHRKAGPVMARKLSVASGGLVSLAELRPDLWG